MILAPVVDKNSILVNEKTLLLPIKKPAN